MKFLLIGIYVFITCIAILAIDRIRSRHYSSGSVIEETHSTDFIDTLSQRKRKQLEAQPWNMKYETYTAIAAICGVLFAVTGYLYRDIVFGIIAGVIGVLIPEIVVRVQAASQKQRFEERYARSLRQLSAGLKSGMSLHQAIEDVAHSPFVHDDVRVEYQQLSADLKLGIPLQDAFRRFYERVKSGDAEDVAIAVAMQAKTGGREGVVIENIAKNIGDRMMLRKEINSMFAGSNTTIVVLDIVPFATIAFMVFGASEFMHAYFESMGMFLIFVGLLTFMLIGSFVTRAMVSKMRKESGVK